MNNFNPLYQTHVNMEESFKLRAWTKADIPALAKYLNNKKIWDNCRDALPYPYTEKDAE